MRLRRGASPVVVSIAIGVRPPSGRPPRARARGLALGVRVGGTREQRLVGDVRGETGLAEDRAVALVLEAERQVLAAALDDPALGEDVDDVRGDVVQQPLVVGDQQDAEVRVEHRVDALGDDPQGVDVEARVGLVEDRHLRLEDGHLEHLEPLLLAAREALVDVAAWRSPRPSAAWPSSRASCSGSRASRCRP